MRTLVAWLGVVAVLAGSPVLAQDASEERSGGAKVQKYDEVEYGFWMRSQFGMLLSLGDFFGDSGESPLWPPGPIMGLEIGYDFASMISALLSVTGLQVSGTETFTRSGKTSEISHDATGLVLGAGLRFALMTTQRLAWYVKGGVGYALTFPEVSGFEPGLAIQGATGLEYATALRHFFLGLEAGVQFQLPSSGLMVLVTPTVKYTF